MYVNKFDSNGSAEIGHNAFRRFERVAVANGWAFERAPKERDIKEHIDCFIRKGELQYAVDVKALKRVSRHGDYMLDRVWIELGGVNGTKGWLHGSNSDLIAFENASGFYLIKRADIISFIETLDMPITPFAYDALYKVYTRKGRYDRLTQIKLTDVPTFMNWYEYVNITGAVQESGIPEG